MNQVRKIHKNQLMVDLLWDCGVKIYPLNSELTRLEYEVVSDLEEDFVGRVVEKHKDELYFDLMKIRQALHFVECADSLEFYFVGCDEEVGGQLFFKHPHDQEYSDEFMQSCRHLKEAIRFLFKQGLIEPMESEDDEG